MSSTRRATWVTVRVTNEERARFARLATRTGRSLSDWARVALLGAERFASWRDALRTHLDVLLRVTPHVGHPPEVVDVDCPACRVGLMATVFRRVSP